LEPVYDTIEHELLSVDLERFIISP